MTDKEITQKYENDLQKVIDTLATVPATKEMDDSILESIRIVCEIKSYFKNYLILHEVKTEN